MPFFSVVIPLYNKAPHVARSVGSVLKQTFQNYELIIVNDASTDGSVEEVLKFYDPRIRLLHRDTPGPGGYAARNLGIKEARAEWIAFLDADDEWMLEYLENMYTLSRTFREAQMLCCGWKIYDKGMFKINPFLKQNISGKPQLIDLKQYLKIHAQGLDLTHTNVTILSKYILTILEGFPCPNQNCLRAGDGQTWLRAMLLDMKAAWLPYAGAIYYRNAVNMVTEKICKLEENGLMSFMNNYLITNPDFEYATLLKKYRNKRVLNYLHSMNYDADIYFIKHDYGLICDKRYIMYLFLNMIPQNRRQAIYRVIKKIYNMLKIRNS